MMPPSDLRPSIQLDDEVRKHLISLLQQTANTGEMCVHDNNNNNNGNTMTATATANATTEAKTNRVQFADEITKYHFESIGEEDAREMWYNRKDYRMFKREIKDCVRRRSSNNGEEEEEDYVFEPRGIEHLLTKEGLQGSALAVQCVLLTYRAGCHPETVATVSQRLSQNFSLRSTLLGCLDYLEAYQPLLYHMLKHISETTTSSLTTATTSTTTTTTTNTTPSGGGTPTPSATTCTHRKRRATVSDDEDSQEDNTNIRNVRQRTCC